MEEKKNETVAVFYSVLFGIVAILFLFALCTAAKWRDKYNDATRTYSEEVARLERELTESRELIDEYNGRFEQCIDTLTRARSDSGEVTDILRDSIDIIDELTGILFPVEQTEKNLESSRNSRYHRFSATDLYNRSCIDAEEVNNTFPLTIM